jgi:ABC-type thiamine transport system ATPase subunit
MGWASILLTVDHTEADLLRMWAVALDRLLLQDAPILVLDEPSVELDAASAERTLGPSNVR